jgi:hypothetical protein
MGLSSMNLLIRLAERAYPAFDCLDKPEGRSLLLSSGVATDRAAFADLCHASVSTCYLKYFHKCSKMNLAAFENTCTAMIAICQRKAFPNDAFGSTRAFAHRLAEMVIRR